MGPGSRYRLLLLAVVFFSFCPAGGPLAHPVKLTILHLNDIHGHYESYPEEGSPGLVGGLAKAKTVIDRIRQENRKSGRETFVLFAGDLFIGYSLLRDVPRDTGSQTPQRHRFHRYDRGKSRFRLRPGCTQQAKSGPQLPRAGGQCQGRRF